MTICMAAVCGDDKGAAGSAVVVAADRMVTMANLIEFEHTAPKSTPVGTRALALIAGDALIGTHLVREVAAEISATPMTVTQLAQALSSKYSETRTKHAEADVLVPRGLTWATFYGQHQHLIAQVTMMLDQQLNQYNLGVELLIAGVDDGGGHISTLHNPGSRHLDHDVIGYAAVGSGSLHAIQSMIGFRHGVDCSLNEALFRVYASKRRSEVAPGVGKETDMFIVRSDGITNVSPGALAQLGTLFAQFEVATEQSLQGGLRDLDVTETKEKGRKGKGK